MIIMKTFFFCAEKEVKEVMMIEQLHMLVAQRNKTGIFIKFSVSAFCCIKGTWQLKLKRLCNRGALTAMTAKYINSILQWFSKVHLIG